MDLPSSSEGFPRPIVKDNEKTPRHRMEGERDDGDQNVEERWRCEPQTFFFILHFVSVDRREELVNRM